LPPTDFRFIDEARKLFHFAAARAGREGGGGEREARLMEKAKEEA
jgi:hypothetical protein